MLKGRRWRLGLALGFVGAVAGCGRPTRVESAARGGILLLGNGAEPKDIDPQTLSTSGEYTIATALFEGLVDIAGDGRTIRPGAAERWEISPDGKDYTFHLRPGLRWSDGSPLTSQDFLYAFRRAFEPLLGGAQAVYGFAISGAEDYATGRNRAAGSLGIRAPDPGTLQIRLDHRQSYFLYLIAGAPFVPVPREVVERFGGGFRPGTAWTRPGNLVGNGPFVLQSWRPHEDLVVRKNPAYWDAARIQLREVHFLPIDDPQAEERAFRAGELHVTDSLPASRAQAYRERADPRLHITPLYSTGFLVFNTRRPPFDRVLIRRAFSLALDRARLIPRVLGVTGEAAHALTRPGTAGYTPLRLVDYDLEQAHRLLVAAGYPRGVGFPPVALAVPNVVRPELAEAMQEVWRRDLGVRVTIAVREGKSFYDEVEAGQFDFAVWKFFYAVNAPETMLVVPTGDSHYNYAGWKEPAYNRAYATALTADTEGARRAAYDAMETLISDQAPYAPLYYSNRCFLVSPRVRGWEDNPLGQIDWPRLWLAPNFPPL